LSNKKQQIYKRYFDILHMDRKKRDGPEGLAIPAGLFVGMGIGFMAGSFVAWMFIGLGAGFLAMLIARMLGKKK
jgi:hypothetical protein